LVRHSAVVVGQLRTTELIRQIGWPAYFARYALTTFQSFWGQFGWMAAPLPARAYAALMLVMWLGSAGLLAALGGLRHADEPTRRGVYVLVLWSGFTAASYLWYNTQFVQFQGRYLFPALTPLMVGLTYGLSTLPLRRGWAIGAVSGAVVALVAVGLVRGDLPGMALALCVIAAIALLALSYLPERWRWLAPYGVALGLAALSAWSLWNIVIPALAP